jgi:hypothetical protein
MPKKKKVTKRFSEIGTFKEKLTPTDGQTHDGQVDIRKAPLPDGTAELKSLLLAIWQLFIYVNKAQNHTGPIAYHYQVLDKKTTDNPMGYI